MKAILWLRTSTDKQEVDSMLSELTDFANRFGYNEWTVIGKRGASAIKADEAYRNEINNLYSELSTGEYDCLFAWELSRLGRREEYVIKLKNYLIEHHIQLRIYKPQLYLLEDDGEVNAGMELAISLLLTLAKQEMSVKMERMLRGRKRSMSEGKFSGGKCLRYGYRLDEEGYIRVDAEQSRNVIQMFDMYANQNMSSLAIYRYFNERGVFPDYANRGSGSLKVMRMLKDMTYAGKSDRGNKYPSIVSEQTVIKAIKKAKESISLPKTITKHIYYAKGLVFCAHCKHTMVACSNNMVYRCSQFGHSLSISINIIDFIAWFMTKRFAPDNIRKDIGKRKREYKRLMHDENSAIDGLTQKIRHLDEKYERLTELYIESRITKSQFDEKASDIAQERTETKDSVVEHTNRLIALGGLLEGISQESVDLSKVDDDELRRKHIVDAVKRIEVEKIASDSYRSSYKITVQMNAPSIDDEWFEYRADGKYFKLMFCRQEGKSIDCFDISTKVEARFSRSN